jgi:glycosyltransferase involved in cell wall biosynthesis
MKNRKSLRVIVVSPSSPPIGGIATWTDNLLEERHQLSGFDLIHINTALKRKSILMRNILSRISDGIIGTLLASIRLSRKASEGADVVHITTSGGLAFCRDAALLMICKVFGIPAVVHMHHGKVADYTERISPSALLFKVVAALATKVALLDQRSVSSAEKKGSLRDKVVQLPNFSRSAEKLNESKNEDDDACVKDSRGDVVLFVGWLTKEKGIEDLIGGWKEARTMGNVLNLIGPGKNEYVRKLSKHIGERKDIRIVGQRNHDEILQEIKKAKLIVLPSYAEGFPQVIVEAMALGTPVIASAVGAIPEMLAEGCGWIIRAGDKEELAGAITDVLGDPERRARMAGAARLRYETQYNSVVARSRLTSLWCAVAKQNIE